MWRRGWRLGINAAFLFFCPLHQIQTPLGLRCMSRREYQVQKKRTIGWGGGREKKMWWGKESEGWGGWVIRLEMEGGSVVIF
jgi:hypothetical protein